MLDISESTEIVNKNLLRINNIYRY